MGAVVVSAEVAGGSHVEDSSRTGCVEGGHDARIERVGAPTVVDHSNIDAVIHLLIDDEVDARDRARAGADAVGTVRLAWHDLDGPIDADHADAVVTHGAHNAGGQRAVAAVVHGIARRRVHEGVQPVRALRAGDALRREWTRRRPDVGRQIRMVVVRPGVDEPHHHVAAVGAEVGPRGLRVDLLQTPQIRRGIGEPVRIVRGCRRGDVGQVVGCCTQHVRAPSEHPERLVDGDVRGQLEVLHLEVLESPQQPASDGPAKSIPLALGGRPTERDQELTGHEWRIGAPLR